MKKVFLFIFTVSVCLSYSCKQKESTNQETVSKIENTTKQIEESGSESKPTGVENTPVVKATAELCGCINNALANMSPRVRSIIIKAGKSSDPIQVLQTELINIADAEEQVRLGTELQEFENNPQLQNCSENVKKEYGFNDNDQKVQRQILEAAEQNKNCEIVSALLKIGLQQEELGKGSSKDQ